MRSTLAPLFALLASSALSGCASLAPHAHPRHEVRGPIPSRNMHPLGLTLIGFRPRRAALQPEGTWRLQATAAYASIEEIGGDERHFASFDGELARLGLALRYGASPGTDVEVELPFLYTTSGFLDDFVQTFHSALSLPNGGREQFENDRFDVLLAADGERLYELEEDRLGLQDVPVHLTARLREEDGRGPALALRVGLELPLGSERAGFGNGALDFGLGLIGERSLGRYTLTGGLDLLFPGQPQGFRDSAEHRISERVALHLGAECRWTDRLSLLLQLAWTSPIISSIPLEEIDREIFDLGLGVAVDTGRRSRFTLSVHEDLVAATGPDFAVLLSFTASL